MQKKINWRLLLLPFSLVYSIIAFVRNKLFDWGILPSSYGVLPTIVIGNLTVGGTGKTPMTIATARLLSKELTVAILSRGYKRQSRDCLLAGAQASYTQIGDEPKLIALKTRLPVAVCADRLQGLQIIKNNMPDTQLVILDDALQHRRLKPDVSILLIDYTRQVFDDFFLPAGNLRDNLYRIKDCDIVVFTKCPASLSEQEAQRLAHKVGKPKDHVFFTRIVYRDLINYFTGERKSIESLFKYKVFTISGLANNRPFVEFLRTKAEIVQAYEFADHKNYKFAELQKIFYNFAQLYTDGKLIITTDKDFVKISEFDLPEQIRTRLFVLPIDVEFLIDSQENFKHKIFELWKKTC